MSKFGSGHPSDEWYTPAKYVEYALSVLPDLTGTHVYCPCDGMGSEWVKQISRVAHVTNTQYSGEYDLFERKPGRMWVDGIENPIDWSGSVLHPNTLKIMEYVDWVITNPPFSILNRIVYHLSHAPSRMRWMMVAPLTKLYHRDIYQKVLSRELGCTPVLQIQWGWNMGEVGTFLLNNYDTAPRPYPYTAPLSECKVRGRRGGLPFTHGATIPIDVPEFACSVSPISNGLALDDRFLIVANSGASDGAAPWYHVTRREQTPARTRTDQPESLPTTSAQLTLIPACPEFRIDNPDCALNRRRRPPPRPVVVLDAVEDFPVVLV